MVLAALTLGPDAFQVGVDFFGISNWVRTLENTVLVGRVPRGTVCRDGRSPNRQRPRLRQISPLFHADKIKVPLMVLPGANDPRVLGRVG